MFNGIVEGTLKVLSVNNYDKYSTLEFSLLQNINDLNLGSSISINGVCLTASKILENSFCADLMPETLAITNLKSLNPGNIVNYERCLKLGARIEGHIVKGHVDGIGEIKDIRQEGNSNIITISTNEKIANYLVPKASIGIDGMSITIIDVIGTDFTIGLIPYTLNHTIAKNYQLGTEVNLEIDDMAKYMLRYLETKYSNIG